MTLELIALQCLQIEQAQLQVIVDEFSAVITTKLGMVNHDLHEVDTVDSNPNRLVPYRRAPGWRAELQKRNSVSSQARHCDIIQKKFMVFPMVPVQKKKDECH